MIQIQINEKQKEIRVTLNGLTHTGTWDDDEGELHEDKGSNRALLHAAMIAWNGPPHFELTPQELKDRSGGWWSPGD